MRLKIIRRGPRAQAAVETKGSTRKGVIDFKNAREG
jgi:hypothetical protein